MTLVSIAKCAKGEFGKRILNLLASFERKEAMVDALAELIPALSPEVQGQAVQLALEVVAEASDDYLRARIYAQIAAHLSPEQLSNVLVVTEDLRSPGSKALALSGILPHLTASDRTRLLPELWADLGRTRFSFAIGYSLQLLANWLPPSGMQVYVEVARSIRDEVWLARSLIAATPRLPLEVHESVISTALQIEHPAWRARLLLTIASNSSVPSRDQLLDLAIAAARQVQSRATRAELLVQVAEHRPDARKYLVEEAFAASQAIGDEFACGVTRMRLVLASDGYEPDSAGAPIFQGLEDVETTEQTIQRLAEILPFIPPPFDVQGREEALVALKRLPKDLTLVRGAVLLAPCMPASERRELVSLGVTVAATIREEARRAEALRSLIPFLADDVLLEAMDIALRITNPFHRAKSLATLAWRSTPSIYDLSVAHTLSAARVITVDADKAEVIGYLSECLSAKFLQDAIAVARTIGDVPWRVEALAKLALSAGGVFRNELVSEVQNSAKSVLRRERQPCALVALSVFWATFSSHSDAIRLAAEIEDPIFRSCAIVALANLLPDALIGEARDAALSVEWPQWRAEALLALLPRCCESDRTRVVESVIQAITQVVKASSRAELYAEVAPYFARIAPSQAFALWSVSIEGWSKQDRADVMRDFAAMSPAFAATLSVRAVRDLAQTIDDIARWWP